MALLWPLRQVDHLDFGVHQVEHQVEAGAVELLKGVP